MTQIRYKSIGVIRTPFPSPEGVPIQPAAAQGIVGRVELDLKPYVPQFDGADDVRIGWLKDNIRKLGHTRDDGRFRKKTSAGKSE